MERQCHYRDQFSMITEEQRLNRCYEPAQHINPLHQRQKEYPTGCFIAYLP